MKTTFFEISDLNKLKKNRDINNQSMQEIDLQSQFKFIEELKNKNEEYQIHISQLTDNLSIGGEEKLKQYYSTIQQQISLLQYENQELRNNLHVLHNDSLAFYEGKETENQNNIHQIKNILTNISTLIISKGKEGVIDLENTILNKQSHNFDLLQETQSQIIRLIQQNHKRKKEKKKLQQKCKDLQEKEIELQNTIHIMTTEREQDLYQQQQLQLLQLQQQQLDQQLIQNFNRQLQGSYNDQNSNNSTPIQQVSPKLTFLTNQYFYQQQNQKLDQSQLSQLSQQSHQSQGLIKDFIEDSVQKLNKSEQVSSFQTPHLPNSSVDQVSNGDLLERLRRSTQYDNIDDFQKISLQKNESYQNQIQEILQLKDTHYNNIINDLNKQINDLNKQINDLYRQNNDLNRQNNELTKQINDLTHLNRQNSDIKKQFNDLNTKKNEIQTKDTTLIYILTKLIQNLQSRVNRLSGLLKQQTIIVFLLIDSQQQELKQNKNKIKISQSQKAMRKFKVIINSVLFIKKIQKTLKCQQNTNINNQQMLFKFDPSQISLEKGLKNFLQTITKDIQNDLDMYKSVKQITQDSQPNDNTQNINFKEDEFIRLINQINKNQSQYERSNPIYNNQVQVINIQLKNQKDDSSKEISKDSISKDIQKNSDNDETYIEKEKEVQKEKEIIETENIYLKDLIVNLKEENEQIQQKLIEKVKQCKNYYVTLQNYEIQIQKLQNENEINLEKNSRLIDMIDPKDRAILEKQSVLDDLSEYQENENSQIIETQPNTKNVNQNIKPK